MALKADFLPVLGDEAGPADHRNSTEEHTNAMFSEGVLFQSHSVDQKY